jgi:hypothetical protein
LFQEWHKDCPLEEIIMPRQILVVVILRRSDEEF